MGPRVLFQQNVESEVRFDNVFALCEESATKYAGKNRDHVKVEDDDEPDHGEDPKHLHLDIGSMLHRLSKLLERYQEQVDRISTFAPLYDSRTGVRANGYRSFVRIASSFVYILTDFLLDIHTRKRILTTSVEKGLRVRLACLEKLVLINDFLLEIESLEDSNELFPISPDVREEKAEELSIKIAMSDFSCFYGSLCGFHIGGDCRRLARPLVTACASFGDVMGDGRNSYISRAGKLARSAFGIRYAADPELLAAKVSETVKEQQVDFCKNFYSLSEMNFLESHFGGGGGSARRGRPPQIKANLVIEIPPQRMRIMNTQGAAFQVPVPSSYLGSNKSISARLISPFRTPDMVGGNCPCIKSIEG